MKMFHTNDEGSPNSGGNNESDEIARRIAYIQERIPAQEPWSFRK